MSVPDATLIVAQPFDPSTSAAIERAIRQADLGLNPSSDGKMIRIPVPSLTEERRKEIVKKAHDFAEASRNGIRQARREGNDALKKLEKDKEISQDDERRGHDEMQKLHDHYIGVGQQGAGDQGKGPADGLGAPRRRWTPVIARRRHRDRHGFRPRFSSGPRGAAAPSPSSSQSPDRAARERAAGARDRRAVRAPRGDRRDRGVGRAAQGRARGEAGDRGRASASRSRRARVSARVEAAPAGRPEPGARPRPRRAARGRPGSAQPRRAAPRLRGRRGRSRPDPRPRRRRR